MTFISEAEVERCIQENGMVATLRTHGRSRVAPGYTVADWIAVGEFYSHAHHPKRGDLKYWDNFHRQEK